MDRGHYPKELRLQQERKRRALCLVVLKDKIKGARKDLFELELQARVPPSIKRLRDVKKDTSQYCPRSRVEEMLFVMQRHCWTVERRDRKPNWWERMISCAWRIGRRCLRRSV
jgi:hypothetical protein